MKNPIVKNPVLRLAITAGEPAGIGPDLILQIAQLPFPAELVVIADPALLLQRAKQLNLFINLLEFNEAIYQPHQPRQLSIIRVPLATPATAGKLNKANAAYVIKTLGIAAQGCLDKKFHAVVTAPVHKAIINEAGIPFSGHTEFFADFSKTPQVVMMLMAKKMRVALVTTHLPIAKVASAITPEKLEQVIKILQHSLQTQFSIAKPQIFVAGLNPHAGENGQMGREEIEIIIPTLNKLRGEGISLNGPLPADTLFLEKNLQQADAFLCMYHDQGLPVLKFYGFDAAVNITLGLPFIRTSVDHGTALELAGTGTANPGSLLAAIKTAIELAVSIERKKE